MFKKFITALASVGVMVITLYAGKYFTSMGVNGWYSEAIKPALTPPNYVFPIVWSILYVLQAISLYRILYYGLGGDVVSIFVIQLSLQVLWCLTFFAIGSAVMGLIVVIMLIVTAISLIKILSGRDIWAARLLYPYLLWIVFAGYLNLGFVI